MTCGDHRLVAAEVAGKGIVGQGDVVGVLEFGPELGDGPVVGKAAVAEPTEDIPADGPPREGELGFGVGAKGNTV